MPRRACSANDYFFFIVCLLGWSVLVGAKENIWLVYARI